MTPMKSIAIPTTSQSINDAQRAAHEAQRSDEMAVTRLVSPKRITALLGCAMILLILAGAASKYVRARLGEDGLRQHHIWEITRQFDLDEENNFPTYYQSASLLFCSLLLMLVSSARRRAGDRYYAHWRVMALFFLFLSLDEAASLHEATIEPLREVLGLDDFFHFAWVVPAIIAVSILTISYLRFLLSLPAGTRYRFMIAGAFYVGGAVGMEMVGGHLRKLYGEQSLQYVAGTVVEESLEMIGVWLFICALLSCLSAHVKELLIKIVGESDGPDGARDDIGPGTKGCRPHRLIKRRSY